MIKTCQFCKKQFQSKLAARKYCSKPCANAYLRGENRHNTTCPRCGEIFNQRTDSNPQHVFCSLSCARMGEKRNVEVHCSDAFGNWFAGFVDGEGSFLMPIYKKKSGTRYGTRFHLGLRIDDMPIIEEIISTLGFGTSLRQRPSFDKRHNKFGNPQAFFAVDNIDDCSALISLFQKYPLRAKKAKDFEVWTKAVLEKAKGGKADQSILEQCAKDIREIRKFK